jgi:hypothetical protein
MFLAVLIFFQDKNASQTYGWIYITVHTDDPDVQIAVHRSDLQEVSIIIHMSIYSELLLLLYVQAMTIHSEGLYLRS